MQSRLFFYFLEEFFRVFLRERIYFLDFSSAPLLFLFFGYRMLKKTSKGAEAFWHAQGFRKYIKTAEKHRVKFKEKENIFLRFCLTPWFSAWLTNGPKLLRVLSIKIRNGMNKSTSSFSPVFFRFFRKFLFAPNNRGFSHSFRQLVFLGI